MNDSPSVGIRTASLEAGRHIDILFAVTAGLGVLAAAAWIGAVVVAVQTDTADNSNWVVLAASWAGTLTGIATITALAGVIRRYVRAVVDKDVSVVCRRLDDLSARLEPKAPTNGAHDLSDDWRAYLSGQLEARPLPDN